MPKPQYGAAHQKLRREWKKRVDTGGVHCHHQPACLEDDTLLHPGATFDLGHVDGSTTEYTGPEHPRCNRGTARIWKQKATKPEQEYQWFT